jgi:hypothetical protein
MRAIMPEKGHSFHGYEHHVLFNQNTKIRLCSAEQGVQNIDINNNDMLCQSYALLNYFNVPLDKLKPAINEIENAKITWTNQMKMIDLYDQLLADPRFITALTDFFKDINRGVLIKDPWISYQYHITGANQGKEPKLKIINVEKDLIKPIKTVLEQWRAYGYWFFIGEGVCHTKGYFMNFSNPSALESTPRSSRYTVPKLPSGITPKPPSASRPSARRVSRVGGTKSKRSTRKDKRSGHKRSRGKHSGHKHI